MTLDELQTIISQERNTALGSDGSKLSVDRRQAWELYNGDPLGNEIQGRSQVVMRTVLETVEWILPALLRIFTQSKIASVEPRRPDQEGAAEQATDYIDYIFNQDNPGFLILYTWFKDALVSKLAWVKVRWDTQDVEETVSFENLTREQYDALLNDEEYHTIKTEEESQHPAYVPDPMSAEPDMAYDCTLRRVRTEGRVKIEPVPSEEVLPGRRAKAIDAQIPFITHRIEWLVSDLLEQGYDEDGLKEIAGVDTPWLNSEKVERQQRVDNFIAGSDRVDFPMMPCWVDECYIRVDWNGDGIAELIKVNVAAMGENSKILTKKGKPDIEEVPEIPLIPLTPMIMPHMLVGMGIGDLVDDLQVINTTLMRQVLDAGYFSLAPRTVVGQGAVNENTYDDLLTVRPGQIIRAKDASQIVPMPNNFSPEQHLPLLEFVGQIGEIRTGVSRRNQGLSPDDLNKTATGINLIQQAADQRSELIARVFAHGVKTLVERILSYVKRYQQTARIIKLTGKINPETGTPWFGMDPRQWKDQMDVSVSVGLGTGNRDQIAQHAQTILQLQAEILGNAAKAQAPQFAALVTPQNVFDAGNRLTESLGFKEPFLTDPREAQQQGQGGPPQPPPDPKMMQAQHGMQLDAQKAQIDTQLQQAKAQQDAQLQDQRLKNDMAIQHAQLQADQRMAQQRFDFEREMETLKFQHDMRMEQYREDRKSEIARHEIDTRAKAGGYSPKPERAEGASA